MALLGATVVVDFAINVDSVVDGDVVVVNDVVVALLIVTDDNIICCCGQ